MKRVMMGCALAVLLVGSGAFAAEVKGEVKRDEAAEKPGAAAVEQVNRLISEGGTLYGLGQFENAIKLADAALVLDPESQSAKELKSISEEGIRDRDRRNFIIDQRRQLQREVRHVDRDAVGQSALLQHGPNWGLVKGRTGGVYGEAATVAEANKPIERRLDELTISVDFKDATLREVAEFLGNLGKLNVQVDPRAMVGEKPAPEATVTFKARDLTLRSALEWVARFTGLTYTVRDQVVLITDAAHVEEFKVTAVYDITDIITEIPDYPSVPDFDFLLPSINARRIGDGFRRAPDFWYRQGMGPFTGAYFSDYEEVPRYFMTEAEVRALIEALIEAEEDKEK
jgi:hypothetical protein